MSFLYIVSEKKKGRQFNERVHTQVEWMRQKAILLPVFFLPLEKTLSLQFAKEIV